VSARARICWVCLHAHICKPAGTRAARSHDPCPHGKPSPVPCPLPPRPDAPRQALAGMAKAEGFHFEETLTGFKWLGNVAARLEAEGYTVLFAYEEAIGFMFSGVHKVGGVCACLYECL
jgi:hypothetical protein